MAYYGDLAAGAILNAKFTTVRSNGQPDVLTGGTVKVYRDDDTTTESTTGVTLSVTFDSITGLNNVKVDTSADATFYAVGHDYQLIITAGSLNNQSLIGYVIGSFSIGNRTLSSATLTAIANALWDLANGIETGVTPRQAMRLLTSAEGGKTSGMDTGSVLIRDVNDTKNRITATADANGNRTAVTLNLT